MVLSMPSSRLTTVIFSLCILFLVFTSFTLWSPVHYANDVTGSGLAQHDGRPINPHLPRPSARPIESAQTARLKQAEAIMQKAAKVAGSPIEAPYKYKFATLGHLARSARKWVQFLEDGAKEEDSHVLHEAIEGAIASLFPYLLHSPKHPGSTTPFADLRDSFVPGSRGIVIPTGKSTMRYAAHLITSLQDVLETSLPILVVYAGEEDLPAEDRKRLQSRFNKVEFLDVLTVVDDSLLKLGDGGWAIKAFAAIYAPYEQVILADADCVFAQLPENIFKDPSYIENGALLFHDRLLWQHAYKDRHAWWQSQIQHPSPAMNKSLVWTQDYAEEGDSGVVVLDKSRIDVLMGLLHTGWQNTKAVRDEVTYRMTHGDKESWWLGLELSGATYAFERYYGAMVGWPSSEPTKEGEGDKVCSFYIGHVDADDELLWYNGGFLKNKHGDAHEFGLPTHLMIDGKWHKSGDKNKESCMDQNTATELPKDATDVLDRSISLAKELDKDLGFA